MKNITAAEAERRLNDHYSDNLSFDEAKDDLVYLTNKNRHGGHTTIYRLTIAYHNRKLGSLLRRLDPIAFNCAKNDMK